MRLSPSLAVQGRSGYQRGSEACSSLRGTGTSGSSLLPQPATSGMAEMAIAAAAARREVRWLGFIVKNSVPELGGDCKFAVKRPPRDEGPPP